MEAYSYHFTPLDSLHDNITDTDDDSNLVADGEWLFCGSAGQGHHLRVAVTDLQVTGRCLRVNHKYMQVAWILSKMRVARCELRDASCDCHMWRDWEILWRMPLAYPWRTFVTLLS